MNDFDPEEWLAVAELCCNSGQAEAHLRTAINRAYYAALLSTKQRIEQAMGSGTVPHAGTHSAILRAVDSGGRKFKRILGALRHLKRVREVADYELEAEPPERHWVRSQVKLSRDVIRNHIKKLPDTDYRTLRVPSA